MYGVSHSKNHTSSSLQIVSTTRLVGAEHPLEMVYFVEGPSGERQPAITTANLLNRLDVQRAAIILGYRVEGILATRKFQSATVWSQIALCCLANSYGLDYRVSIYLLYLIYLSILSI